MIELSEDNNNDSNSPDIGTVVLEKDPQVKEPPSYQVVLINDDYTPMEFVVFVLQTVFGHSHEKSTEIIIAPGANLSDKYAVFEATHGV